MLDADDDLQPATTSVQLATAMRASIGSQPRLHPAQQQQPKRRPPARASQPIPSAQQYDDEDEQHEHEEEAGAVEPAMASRTQQTAFTFKPAQRPRSRAPSYSSSLHDTLTPTSMAAFDPLTTPATKAAASRAITKRSSLTLPSPRPTQPPLQLASSSDPFDVVDPSPPSYEQVLASDDVISAQFSGMLALEPPAAVEADADAAHIKRMARREQELRNLQEQEEVREEVDQIMAQIVPRRPDRPARRQQRAAPRPAVRSYEEQQQEEEYFSEEVKHPARVRRQHPRYAMSAEEEEEAPHDVQQVQRPTAKTVQRVARTARQERYQEEAEAEDEIASVRQQQPRVARKRQSAAQREEQLDGGEEYAEAQPIDRRVRRPPQQATEAAEEKIEGRGRQKSLEWYEERRKEVRGGQRRLSADMMTAAAPVRNAKPARRSLEADDVMGGKGEKLSRSANSKSTVPRTLSASPQPRLKSASSASSSSTTKPYRPRSIKVDALAFMQAGTPFLKYSSSYFSSPPHFRQFLLVASTPAYVQWFSQNKPLTASRIYLESISAIPTGQTTPTFAKHRAVELESMSFSLLYTEGGRERSLDLTAKDKNEMNVWVKGLEKFVRWVKKGETLEEERNWRKLLVELPVVYGGNGSASQPLVDAESGQVVDVRGRSSLKGAGGGGEVEASLYTDLQPRLQRLEAALVRRRDEVKGAKGSSVYTVVREKVKRVEGICKLVGDALMDGALEEADQQMWLGNLELNTVSDMIASAKSEK